MTEWKGTLLLEVNSCWGGINVGGALLLAHELVQLDILGIFPPFLPPFGVSSSDGYVADASVEPDIEDLLFVAWERDRSTPFEICYISDIVQ